jgi:hypothetical protein
MINLRLISLQNLTYPVSLTLSHKFTNLPDANIISAPLINSFFLSMKSNLAHWIFQKNFSFL